MNKPANTFEVANASFRCADEPKNIFNQRQVKFAQVFMFLGSRKVPVSLSKLSGDPSKPTPKQIHLDFSRGETCDIECEDEDQAVLISKAIQEIVDKTRGKLAITRPVFPSSSEVSQAQPTSSSKRSSHFRDDLDFTNRSTLPMSNSQPVAQTWISSTDGGVSHPGLSTSSSTSDVSRPQARPLEDTTPQPGGDGSAAAAAKRARIDAHSGTRNDANKTPEKVREYDRHSSAFRYQNPTREKPRQPSLLQVSSTPKMFQQSASYSRYRSNHFFGLQNLGNTCYLNAVMQALCSLREFVSNLRKMPEVIPQLVDCTLFSGSSEILHRMSSAAAVTGPLSPAKLRELIAKASPMFAGSQQQDAHEFLLEYVNQLHDELLGARKVWLDAQSLADDEEHQALGKLTTQEFLDSEVQKTLRCINCKESRDVFERFRDFSLDFPAAQQTPAGFSGSNDERCELGTMLHSYFKQELLEVRCENCGAVAANMSKQLTRDPKVLVLHLKRFVPNVEKQRYEKQHQSVEIPLVLDLKTCLREAYAGSSSSSAAPTPSKSTLPARPFAAEAMLSETTMRCPATQAPAVWEVRLEDQWQAFAPEEARQLEEFHDSEALDYAAHGPNGAHELKARGQKYWIDLKTWSQTNQESKMSRPIRRQERDSHTEKLPRGPVYNLRSAISHDGASPHSGHYVCYARNEQGAWRLYDDSLVKDLPSGQDTLRSLGRKAYILFYVLQE